MPIQLDDKSGGLLHQGRTPPRPSSQEAPVTDFVENPLADASESYVLLIDGVDGVGHDHIDWSRHLPPEVPLKRREHDKSVFLPLVFVNE
jgi:hypothetical protein